MTEKVIYVSFIHLTDKTARDWYIDFLIGKGVKVEYWDVVALVRDAYIEANAKQTEYLKTFLTYGKLEEALRLPENRNARYMMLVSYTGETARLYRVMSKYNCRMLFIAWGALPIAGLPKWQTVLFGLSNPLRLAKRIYYRVKASAYRRLGLVNPFDTEFAAGQACVAKRHFASKVVPINLIDYDHFKKTEMGRERLVQGRFCVFLDVNLPHHPDLKMAGLQAVDPQDYYAALNHFFDLVEAEFGVQVVIAAHPSANYNVNPFHGREILRLRTPELVRDADFTIAHHSTSISYAVLNHKPVIFIYTNEMAALYKRTVAGWIRDYATYLDAPLYNVDEITEGCQIDIAKINEKRYEDYKYSFLTSQKSENMATQEIFWREINMEQNMDLQAG
jgi:hypothetical protein